MENLIKDLYNAHKNINDLKKKLEVAEAKLKDDILLVVAELNSTDKKLKLEVPETKESLVISRRDYKQFTEDVDLDLKKEKKRYESEISTHKMIHKQNTEAIKRQAEIDGKVSLDLRYYINIE